MVDEEEDVVLPSRFKPTLPPSPLQPPQAKEEDEVTRLKSALQKAEQQIAQLKTQAAMGRGPGEAHELHARPLLPNMMPGTLFPPRKC